MANLIVNTFKSRILQANIDFDSDTFKLMLLTSSHTTDIDTQEFIDDVSANEVSGSGYSAGGETIANMTVSTDDTDDEGVADGDDVSWASSTITARYGVVYKDTGTPATSPIVGILDFGSDQTSTNGTFTVSFNAEGIVNIG